MFKCKSALRSKLTMSMWITIYGLIIFLHCQVSAFCSEKIDAIELEKYSAELIETVLPTNYSKLLRPCFGGKTFI